RQDASRLDHEIRKRASPAHNHRGRLALSTSTAGYRRTAQTAGGRGRAIHRDRVVCSGAAASPLPAGVRGGEVQAEGRHGSRPRAPRIHLGPREWRGEPHGREKGGLGKESRELGSQRSRLQLEKPRAFHATDIVLIRDKQCEAAPTGSKTL